MNSEENAICVGRDEASTEKRNGMELRTSDGDVTRATSSVNVNLPLYTELSRGAVIDKAPDFICPL